MLLQMGAFTQQHDIHREVAMLRETSREAIVRSPLGLTLRAPDLVVDREGKQFARGVAPCRLDLSGCLTSQDSYPYPRPDLSDTQAASLKRK